MFHKYRSRSFKVLCTNGVLDSFPKFPRKHLGRSLLLKRQQSADWLKSDSGTGIFLRIVQSFKTYFEELLQIALNNNSKQYNNNLLRENKPLAPTGTRKDNSWSIGQIRLLYQRICSNKNRLLKLIWFTITRRFHVTCIDQSNFKIFAIYYKFSLHIRAEVPNKNLTCIHKETVQLVALLNKRRKQCEPENSFHLTHVKCSRYIGDIIIVILVWSYGYSKCS